MTLTTPYSATFIVGDGETKTFSYLFEEVSPNFISVMVYNSLTGLISTPTYVIDTDQKLVIFGEDTPAPTADETVCIYRNTPNVQDVAFRTLHGYDAQTLENILSKIVAMIQEIKSNYFSTQVLQGDPWQLDLLSSADDGATVNIDYTAKKLVKGLYFKITSGNLQVSADGANYMTLPKSDDVAEFRQYEQTLPDLTVIRKLQYRVGNQWYDAEANTEAIANKAVEIAEEARDIAEEARDIANDAKDTAENIDGKAQQALDNSIEAVETAEEVKNMIQNQIIVRSATMPTASADLVDKNYQYAGATNSLYTHNYIYECQATEINTLTFTPNTISCDWANLQTFLETIVPGYSDDVVSGTMTYLDAGDLWAIVFKNANGDTVTSYQQYTGDWEQIGFSFAGSFADGDVVSFERNTTTTYAWVRVDVQPDRIAQIQALQADITDIQALIPAQASPTNQLGDKNFINSSISSNTANFIGTFNSVAELNAYSGTKTNNDYAFVVGTDSAGNTTYNRYKYTTATTPASWIYEYTLNNSSFTAAQWATINSGGTAADVALARSAVQPSDLGNGTITITQGGVTKGTFTTNQSEGVTIDLDTGGTTTGQSIDAEIVGTLTVASNGDVSGLDNSNYLVYPGALDMSSASSFEMVFAFTTGNAVSTAYVLNGVGMGYNTEHDIAIAINSSEKLWFYVNASSDTITGTTTIQPNTKYYVKVVYDGTDYILSLSEDGNNWNTEGSVSATEKPGPLREKKYAIGRSVSSVFSVMHMKECYIKENNILVWQGMDAPGLHQRVSKAEADYVVESQFPTAANNLTWYRKYKSGWVEQGQYKRDITKNQANIVTLPVPMADTNFGGIISCSNITYGVATTLSIDSHSTTQVNLWGYTSASSSTIRVSWEVKGMCAQ